MLNQEDLVSASSVTNSPRNRLMLAVLEEAIVEFKDGINSDRPHKRQRFYDVDHWVSSQDTEWPFSFENICSELKIDPGYIRNGLARIKRGAARPGEDAGERGGNGAGGNRKHFRRPSRS